MAYEEKAAGTEIPPPPPPRSSLLCKCTAADVGLRALLFASTLTALLVLVTSKQDKAVTVAGVPFPVVLEAKFSQSPAFIYFAAALSVACLYSIITLLASISVIRKPAVSASFLLFFVILDVLVLGLVASATGTAGGVAWVGLKGNSHTGWTKICNVYDKFCRHLGASVAVSLFASNVLVFLIILSVLSLHKRIPK